MADWRIRSRAAKLSDYFTLNRFFNRSIVWSHFAAVGRDTVFWFPNNPFSLTASVAGTVYPGTLRFVSWHISTQRLPSLWRDRAEGRIDARSKLKKRLAREARPGLGQMSGREGVGDGSVSSNLRSGDRGRYRAHFSASFEGGHPPHNHRRRETVPVRQRGHWPGTERPEPVKLDKTDHLIGYALLGWRALT